MLLNLCLWIYLASLCWVYGWAVLIPLQTYLGNPGGRSSVNPRNDQHPHPIDPNLDNSHLNRLTLNPPIVSLVGLATIASGAQWLCLIMPMNWLAHLLILALGIVLARLHTQTLLQQTRSVWQDIQRSPWLSRLIWTSLGLLLVFQSSVGPFNYDTGLYHAQAVRWLEEFPTVPGLGNLHGRLAFNSSFFPIAALFDCSFLLPAPLHSLNGLILCLCLGSVIQPLNVLVQGVRSLRSSPHRASHAPAAPRLVVQSLLALPLIRLIYQADRFSVEVASWSTDLPVSALILVTVGLAIAYLDRPSPLDYPSPSDAAAGSTPSVPVAASVSVPPPVPIACQEFTLLLLVYCIVTLKFSALPILLILPYVMVQQIRSRRWATLGISMGLGIFWAVPYLLRNLLLSGYWLYPLPGLKGGTLDWQIPVAIAQADQNAITSWARIPGANPETILHQGLAAWFPVWFQTFSEQFLFKTLVITACLLGVTLLLHWRSTVALLKPYGWVYGLVAIGILFWFLSAPDPRFGYGFLMAGSVLLAMPTVCWLLSSMTDRPGGMRLLGNAYPVLILLVSIQNFQFYPDDRQFLVTPMPYPQLPASQLEVIRLNQLPLYHPLKGDQCWYTPFPCTPIVQPNLSLRGTDWRSGFHQSDRLSSVRRNGVSALNGNN